MQQSTPLEPAVTQLLNKFLALYAI